MTNLKFGSYTPNDPEFTFYVITKLADYLEIQQLIEHEMRVHRDNKSDYASQLISEDQPFNGEFEILNKL